MKQKTNKKWIFLALSFAILFGGVVLGQFINSKTKIDENKDVIFAGQDGIPNQLLRKTSEQLSENIDFTYAAEQSVNGVVHVKTKMLQRQTRVFQDPFFEYFFGQPQMPQSQMRPVMSSGSGVIISIDGYIVTNNHVIDNAEEIEVTLNDKRTFIATVVGKDPTTDIALLKIEAEELNIIPFGNSDDLRVGEWVLAIGNPFNLTSTVTAGIVSAKARSINILNAEMKIESFIQTDAAVNPGNSGGALVNTRGELVGINTAIASQTGSYAGYSFAVPVSIVSKVVADLKQHGEVQRAILGVSISDINNELAKEKNIKTLKGSYVASLVENGAAAKAGIKEGDIIVKVNNVSVNTVAELQEQIGRFRPGDKVKITVFRANQEKEFDVELKNMSGNTEIVKPVNLQMLGASFEELTEGEKSVLRIASGVKVAQVTKNGRFDSGGIQKGFIILKINNKAIRQVIDIETVLNTVHNSAEAEKALFISGVYPNEKIVYYAISLQD